MGNTKFSILILLFSYMDKETSSYTKMSVNKLRELLKKIYKTTVERRWVFYCLADLIKGGLITRQPRHKHESDGTIRQLSSMISFTAKGLKYLMKRKVEGAKKAWKKMLKWIEGLDRRWPNKEDIFEDKGREADPIGLRRLKALTEMVRKPMPG